MLGIAPPVVEYRGIAVVAVKVAQGVGHIDEVNGEAVVGDGVFRVVRESEKPVVAGGVGRFRINRVQVLGIGASVAEVVDVGECAVLEAQVGVVGHAGQDAEGPSLALPVGVFFFFWLYFYAVFWG